MGVVERRAREKEMRRAQIMDAAREVFAANGFGRATMEQIADKAELSPGTLYLYFKSKYELYASLHLRLLHRLADQMETLMNREDLNAPEKIRELPDVMYEVYRFDPLIVINLFRLQASRDLTDLSPEVLEEMNSTSGRALRTMAEIFEEGIRDGYFRDYDPIAMADLVWSAFSGLVLWEESKRLFDPDKQFLKPMLKMAFEVLADGLEKR